MSLLMSISLIYLESLCPDSILYTSGTILDLLRMFVSVRGSAHEITSWIDILPMSSILTLIGENGPIEDNCSSFVMYVDTN